MKLEKEAESRVDPGFEANLAKQIVRGEDWYSKNSDTAVGIWYDGISG